MFVGIISDTHGHVHPTRDAVRMFESLNVQQVIHCGDVGSADVVHLFDRWPTHFVMGNTDSWQLEEIIIRAGHHFHGWFGELVIEERRVAFLHGNEQARFETAISSGTYDLICYGHTHVAEKKLMGKTILLNPGAIHRGLPPAAAVVEFPSLEVTHITL